jgi:N-hydroxyarylamine O-acetyltransferase
MDTGAYWARIGLTGPVGPDAEGLDRMHRAHVAAIPFENFDVQLGRPIRTEPEAVFAKLVSGAAAGSRRGGYCFEQNTLLNSMLTALGFATRRTLARVMWNTGVPGGRTHLINLVEIAGERLIADVGFGGYGLIAPLPLLPGVEQNLAGEDWRVVPSVWAPGFEVQVRPEVDWLPLYWFNPEEPVIDADIVMGNHFTGSHPQSRFIQNRIAARIEPGCRRTLLNRELKIRRNGVLTVETVPDAALAAVLAEHFHLDLPTDAVLPPLSTDLTG